ncbi:MAG: ATP-dependent helicase C-terminal domain-containing protein, partial [Chromatiaceae bacterium]
PGDPLASHPYLVAAGLDAAGRDGRIQLALPITETEIQALFADRIQRERVLTWDPGREAASAQEVTRLGAITLAAQPAPLLPSDPVADLLLARIRRDPGQALDWSDAARQFQARVLLMRALEPDTGWPDLTPAQLEQNLDTWLGPWLAGKSRLDEVQALDLAALLAAQLNGEQRQRLDQEAPASLLTPAGTRRPIDYLAGAIPILAVPLQEMLGTGATPGIAHGRVPLLMQLLSPARRPIQLTRDLPGFWAGSYAQVRKEMRGRYPKHHWPEDPANAAPMARSIKSRG